jgi:hypothetical protein
LRAIVYLGALAASLIGVQPAGAQSSWFTGYYQNVPIVTEKTELSPGGFSDFNRIRLTSEPTLGQFGLEVAYEQAVTFRQNRGDIEQVGRVPGGGEWLDLQWTIADEEHALWRHRFDRLNVSWRPSDKIELIAGRQTVSWATTLFLTPADPFTPFDPADPFRVFRAGVDAARVRIYPSALSEVDLVVRPTKNDHLGEELTVLGRGRTVWGGWEVSGWGGSLYGDTAGAFAAAGSLGAFAVRGEAVVRKISERTSFRGTVGVDRYLAVAGKDMYFVFEYQHDGLAVASANEYLELFQTDPYLRGELQVLGRDETAVQISYQIHPLWGVAAMWLWNLDDGSALLTPSVSYSLSNEASIMGGVFFGFGDDQPTAARPLPSEYGLAGTTGFASVSVYF